MDNLARKRNERRNNNYNWHYVDLEAYADSIRKEERERIKRKNMRKIEIERRKRITMRYWVLQKVLGVMTIIGSIYLALSGFFYDPITDINDCTGLVLIAFFGIGLLVTNEIIFPSYLEQKEQWEIEDAERKNRKRKLSV